MEEIGLILQLILQLIPIVKPSDLQKIKDEISKREKEIEEEKQEMLRALRDGDIAALNRLLFG
jgi:restriction endonuclease S subunit